MRRAVATLAVLGLGLAPGVPLSAGSNQKVTSGGINWYSLEREIALGKQLSAELERQVKLADDPILSEYVNRIAQNIARQADISMPVSVRIVESGDTNAFSLPGGHVYINSGMLKLTESEAELAFVLAHELGHVAARHATREATRGQLAQLGSLPLILLGGWSGAAIRELAAPGTKLGLLKGERAFETEADRIGINLLERSGYDPQSSVDMLERIEGLQRKVPGPLTRLRATHPLTGARIDLAQKLLQSLADTKSQYVISTSEYETMRVRAVALEARRLALEHPEPVLTDQTSRP